VVGTEPLELVRAGEDLDDDEDPLDEEEE